MNDPWKMKYEAIIKGGLQFTGVHARISDWLAKVPGAHYNKGAGCSYINGAIFFNHITFLTEEDLLAFRLVFSEYVYPAVDLNRNIIDAL